DLKCAVLLRNSGVGMVQNQHRPFHPAMERTGKRDFFLFRLKAKLLIAARRDVYVLGTIDLGIAVKLKRMVEGCGIANFQFLPFADDQYSWLKKTARLIDDNRLFRKSLSVGVNRDRRRLSAGGFAVFQRTEPDQGGGNAFRVLVNQQFSAGKPSSFNARGG